MRPAHPSPARPGPRATARRIASLTFITAALAAAPAAATISPAWSHSTADPPPSTQPARSVVGRAPSHPIGDPPDTPVIKG